MNFRSIIDLHTCIWKNMGSIPRDVDLIVGIPRSGLLAANLIALQLNMPLTDIDSFVEKRIYQMSIRRKPNKVTTDMHSFRHALLVDDSLHTGSSMADALQKVSVSNPNCRITTLAVYVAPQAIEKVDIFLEKCPMPRIFEWNLMHNSHLSQSCVDIDGILCRDPEEPENDDGMKYLQFLESADPYLLPTLPIGYLVTCRLEKYRKQTEAWLRRYNIKYNELIMMDLPSKEARVKAGSHGKFKAEAYERTGAILFIESSLRQAVEIANRTCKPVICIETRSLIPPDLMSVNKRLARKLPTWLSSRRKSFINRVKTKLIARAID